MVERVGSNACGGRVTESDGSDGESERPARTRLSSYAKLVLLTQAPVFEHSSIDAFKRWKGAFDELVATHDAQLVEIADLRELLAGARDQLIACRHDTERAVACNVHALTRSIDELDRELG